MYSPALFDVIVTNPAFSLKDEFLARCYELKKPFALLLPLTVFNSVKRQRLFHENGVEILFMPRRGEVRDAEWRGLEQLVRNMLDHVGLQPAARSDVQRDGNGMTVIEFGKPRRFTPSINYLGIVRAADGTLLIQAGWRADY